jgi:hypothetical protein
MESLTRANFPMIVRFIAPGERWEQNGILDQLWAALVEECDEFGAVNWQCGAGDAPPPGKVQMLQWRSSRFGGDETGPNPTDRAKPGTKRSLLVEADGGPLAVVIGGANVHDCKLQGSNLRSNRRRTSKSTER